MLLRNDCTCDAATFMYTLPILPAHIITSIGTHKGCYSSLHGLLLLAHWNLLEIEMPLNAQGRAEFKKSMMTAMPPHKTWQNIALLPAVMKYHHRPGEAERSQASQREDPNLRKLHQNLVVTSSGWLIVYHHPVYRDRTLGCLEAYMSQGQNYYQ